MLNNPFVLIGDIPVEYFCDRQKEVARLVKAIKGEENKTLIHKAYF